MSETTATVVHTYGSELPIRADVLADILGTLGYELHFDLTNKEYHVVEVNTKVTTPDLSDDGFVGGNNPFSQPGRTLRGGNTEVGGQ